jgi:hypothetical protein
MTMKLPNVHFHRHLAAHTAHRRVLGRLPRSSRGEGEAKRISTKLKRIADEYGADDLILGVTNSLTLLAHDNLNQQLGRSSLPSFLLDDLRGTLNTQCVVNKPATTKECQIACDAVVKEYVPLAEPEIKQPSLENNTASIDPCGPPVDPTPSQLVDIGLLWRRTVSRLYENMIYQSIRLNAKSETSEKIVNWLVAISGSIASLQCSFLQAAMDNLQTMQENISQPSMDQETLDAMDDCARKLYFTRRSEQQQRFLSAQSQYRANLYLFRLASNMLTSLFSLFSPPCRYRSS